MIAQVKFTVKEKKDEKSVTGDMTLIPCTISSVEHRNDYCPTLAEGERKADIIQRLNTYSAGMGVVIEADGRVREQGQESEAA